jgi:hypothetical protein
MSKYKIMWLCISTAVIIAATVRHLKIIKKEESSYLFSTIIVEKYFTKSNGRHYTIVVEFEDSPFVNSVHIVHCPLEVCKNKKIGDSVSLYNDTERGKLYFPGELIRKSRWLIFLGILMFFATFIPIGPKEKE